MSRYLNKTFLPGKFPACFGVNWHFFLVPNGQALTIFTIWNLRLFSVYIYICIALYVESKKRWYLISNSLGVPFRKQLLERAFTVSMQMTEKFSWRLSSASCSYALNLYICTIRACVWYVCASSMSQGHLPSLIIWACWGFRVLHTSFTPFLHNLFPHCSFILKGLHTVFQQVPYWISKSGRFP